MQPKQMNYDKGRKDFSMMKIFFNGLAI